MRDINKIEFDSILIKGATENSKFTTKYRKIHKITEISEY